MRTRMLIALAALAILLLGLPASAQEPVEPFIPDASQMEAIPDTDFKTGPGYRAGVLTDVVVGPGVCGWR